MNSSMIYLIQWRNLCKCHSLLPPSTIKEKNPYIVNDPITLIKRDRFLLDLKNMALILKTQMS
jgi:hypothetical protein